MIDVNEKVQCGWCGDKATLKEWDELTYSKCVNREMKRAYTPLTNEKAFSHKSKSFYECPNCHKWSRGNKLSIVDTDDTKLLKLGGEPTMGNYINNK